MLRYFPVTLAVSLLHVRGSGKKKPGENPGKVSWLVPALWGAGWLQTTLTTCTVTIHSVHHPSISPPCLQHSIPGPGLSTVVAFTCIHWCLSISQSWSSVPKQLNVSYHEKTQIEIPCCSRHWPKTWLWNTTPMIQWDLVKLWTFSGDDNLLPDPASLASDSAHIPIYDLYSLLILRCKWIMEWLGPASCSTNQTLMVGKTSQLTSTTINTSTSRWKSYNNFILLVCHVRCRCILNKCV